MAGPREHHKHPVGQHHIIPHPWRVGCRMTIDTAGWHEDIVPGESARCCMAMGVVLSTIPTILWPLLIWGSSGWIFAVTTIAVGFAPMICPLPIFSESDSKSGFDSLSLISATNDCFERHSLVLCQGILWKSHHFLMSFFVFPWPFFSCGLD